MSDATAPSTAPEQVPSEWPAAHTDKPERVFTIRSLLILPAMILLWFFPKRSGASLAEAGWRAALAAHLLGLTIGFGLILWAAEFPWTNPAGMRPITYGAASVSFQMTYPPPEMTFTEYLTAPFAALVLAAHTHFSTGGNPLHIGLILIGGEIALLLLAVLLMPFAAAGESTRRLFGRCLRLTWWSTTMLIPLGIACLLAARVWIWLDKPDAWPSLIEAGISVFGLWWLLVFLRSGYRYGGPAEEPGWQPRTPSCEHCGYNISHLAITTNCPECGNLVADSLADRRRVPAFAAGRGLRHANRTFLPTLRTILFDKTFLSSLALYKGHPGARGFFLILSTLIAVPIAGFTMIVAGLELKPVTMVVIEACAIFAGLVLLAGLMSWVVSIRKKLAIQSSAIVVCYSATGLLPLIYGLLSMLAGLVFSFQLYDHMRNGIGVALGSLTGAVLCTLGGWLTIVGIRCLIWTFRRTRRQM